MRGSCSRGADIRRGEVVLSAKQKILVGRNAVDAYRVAHGQLHDQPWHRRVPEEHTLLLETMVKALEVEGYISSEEEFKDRIADIMRKFWDDSDLENIKELGFESWEDFQNRAKEADREALRDKWH